MRVGEGRGWTSGEESGDCCGQEGRFSAQIVLLKGNDADGIRYAQAVAETARILPRITCYSLPSTSKQPLRTQQDNFADSSRMVDSQNSPHPDTPSSVRRQY